MYPCHHWATLFTGTLLPCGRHRERNVFPRGKQWCARVWARGLQTRVFTFIFPCIPLLQYATGYLGWQCGRSSFSCAHEGQVIFLTNCWRYTIAIMLHLAFTSCTYSLVYNPSRLFPVKSCLLCCRGPTNLPRDGSVLTCGARRWSRPSGKNGFFRNACRCAPVHALFVFIARRAL